MSGANIREVVRSYQIAALRPKFDVVLGIDGESCKGKKLEGMVAAIKERGYEPELEESPDGSPAVYDADKYRIVCFNVKQEDDAQEIMRTIISIGVKIEKEDRASR